jgi:signal transduction histidine kinase
MPETPDPGQYLATLLQLGSTLNSSLDLSQVLHIAIEQVVQFVRAERGFILLVEEGTNRVWGKATRDIDPVALEQTLTGKDKSNRPEVSRTIVEQALKDKKAVVSLNAMEDPRFADATSVKLASVRSVLCVPLIAQGRTLGIVYLDNRIKTGIFDEHQVEMLTAFANQAAVAIDNARLYENLRKSMEERLRLQQDLHENETQRLALKEANRLKSDFIGYISHELRTPLTTIRGYVQTLAHDPKMDFAVRTEFYEIIEAESDRMLDLINELLDSSRLEANRPITLNAREVQLRPMLERLARSQRYYKFWTPNHKLEIQLDEDLPEIVADEDKVHQIVANLLSNAIKYSPDGGEIILAASGNDGGTCIRVSDHGLGMNDEQRSRLFGQYERIERDDIQRIPGTGLGLFLTRRLVELHGGTITCQSEPHQGTVFTVLLPHAPPDPASQSGSPQENGTS